MTSVRHGLLVVAFSAAGLAGVIDPIDIPSDMAFGVKGVVTSSEKATYAVVTGVKPLKALRVYSEPSHTLLMTVVDYTFSLTAEGQTFVTAEPSARSAVLPLQNGFVEFSDAPRRPTTDTRIAVWVLATRESGDKYSLVSDANVGSGDFAFLSNAALGPDQRHCCRWDGSCGELCTMCQGVFFTCCQCLGGYPCSIQCGNVICEAC